MSLLLAGFAFAAPPPGVPGADASSASTLEVTGLFDADRQYGQATLGVVSHWGNLGVDGEISGLAGQGTTNWSDAGFGTLRVGVRAFFGNENLRHAVGVDYRTPVGEAAVGFWVTHYAEALGSPTARFTYDLSGGPLVAPFCLRATLGYSSGSAGVEFVSALLGAGTGLAVGKVFGLGAHAALVTEASLMLDGTPFLVRAGPRWQASSHVSLDLVVGVPVLLLLEHPVFEPALAFRGEL